MIYNEFQGEQLSMLGFGAMRLPLMPNGGAGDIDSAQLSAMVAYAMAHGVNYYDTAYPYHAGRSEIELGKVLSFYPRESYKLASKYPGHQIASNYDPKAVFEDQLKKCGVEYFDFYLLHNVYENSIRTYTDPKWGIIDYFVEQKKLGRIRHLGFSTHGGLDVLKEFLEKYSSEMEFCQIQLNYLDWTLQDARAKVKLLDRYHIPVWVMEPLRGGKLARLSDDQMEHLHMLRPDETPAAWAFRWLQRQPSVKVVLSGMSSYQQMVENVKTFNDRHPVTDSEFDLLMEIAEGMKDSIPCTGCRYCVDGCPMGLNIPMLIGVYNDLRYEASTNVGMRVEALPLKKRPSACIGCKKCMKVCPQSIRIPNILRDLTEALTHVPSWKDISRQREEAAKRLKSE